VTSVRAVGIDLGAKALHVVVLDRSDRQCSIVCSDVISPSEHGRLTNLCEGAARVAIDAPSEPSTAPHAGDHSLSPKFRVARCGEIALGQEHSSWVPWVTPESVPASPVWMQVGFRTWQQLREAGHTPIEVYPAGAFRALAGIRLPKKTTAAGRRARLDVLDRHLELPPDAEMWSHDAIDATVAALVAAWSVADGPVVAAGHDRPGCDGSAIWIPVPA
jgi:predicted nuclease with RNAse H fold